MTNHNRPSWHEYFMTIAKIISSRSTCLSRPTGAIIVKDRHILATGYNGAMPGTAHCIDEGECFRRRNNIPDIDKYNFCRATHAEANALAQAARYGTSVEGATLYTTLAPCYVCLKLLATSCIREIYYEYDYESITPERDKLWQQAVKEAGIKSTRLTVSASAMEKIQQHLACPTSVRRLNATKF
jgi:dCMP deaminase